MFTWLALALVIVGFLGVYSAWTAGRLDRMHRRLDAARAALDAQLRERAEVARRTPALADAAEAALAEPLLDHGREMAENQLSKALRTVTPTAELNEVVTKASFTRQFHNDAVRDARMLRRRRIVRLFHLAGRAPMPAYFEIDDATANRSAEISDVAPS